MCIEYGLLYESRKGPQRYAHGILRISTAERAAADIRHRCGSGYALRDKVRFVEWVGVRCANVSGIEEYCFHQLKGLI